MSITSAVITARKQWVHGPCVPQPDRSAQAPAPHSPPVLAPLIHHSSSLAPLSYVTAWAGLTWS